MRALTAEALLAEAGEALAERNASFALRLFREAELAGADPDTCAGGRWEAHMLLGQFEKAWAESDAIEKRGNPDPYRYWDGKDWRGARVLVRCLHGLGDTLQFVRYLRLLRRDAASVTLEAQPPLKGLLQQCGVADQVITWGDPEPPWQVQMEINELPRIFRIGAATMLGEYPYLRVPRLRVPSTPDHSSKGRLQVGLVWASGDFNPARSIAAELLEPLLALPGVDWHGLQAGKQCRDVARWNHPAFTQHCGEAPNVLELAQRTAGLDLLITVDTMNAHLSGALGVLTWTLLPYRSDWRWMLDRDDSPWYPSMRLFRQPRPGDWRPVLERVLGELQSLLRAGLEAE